MVSLTLTPAAPWHAPQTVATFAFPASMSAAFTAGTAKRSAALTRVKVFIGSPGVVRGERQRRECYSQSALRVGVLRLPKLLQRRGEELAHGGMDAHAARDLVGRLARVHRIEQRMDDFVARDAENRGAQYPARLRIDDHLHESLRLAALHGARDVGHAPLAHEDLASALPRLLHVHAHASERRVDEKAVDRDAVGHLALAALEQVVR